MKFNDSPSESETETSDIENIENSSNESNIYDSTQEDLEIGETDEEDSGQSLNKTESTENNSVVNKTESENDRSGNESGQSVTGNDESSVGFNVSANNSDKIESSDDENVIPVRQKAVKNNRILDSDSESDHEEEQRRKTIYAQNPEGDLSIVEDNVFSKATRRSIFGFIPPVKNDSLEIIDSDDDSDIIICESESEREDFDCSELIKKKLSSTIRSPLKEIDGNVVVKEEKLSPTLEEYDDSEGKIIKRVSKSFYDAQVAERDSLIIRLESMEKMVLNKALPDGGAKLRDAIAKFKNEINEKERMIKGMIINKDESVRSKIVESFKSENDASVRDTSKSDDSVKDNFLVEDVQPKYTGKVGMKNFEHQKALTVEKLNNIHESINQRPAEDVLETPPKYLKVELMRHQLHALAFMIWRENQKPKGGILADDMGLGKTLTVIALILKQLQNFEENEEESSYDESDDEERQMEDEWVARGHKALRDGGTLVVCPASLINQWEQEIKTKLKRGALEVNVFHGAKRICRAKELARYDVVITTYQIIHSEFKNNGCLFDIKWDRIVLDEGHVIRNYRSKQSEAVCALFAKKRWVLSGTPIQNKEFDLFAAIKFLHCSPFNDLRYWKMWIENKNGSSPRLQTLLKSILLRRTKQQLQESGEVKSLPEKKYELCMVKLNKEERAVYHRMMLLSRAIFAQYLSQHQEKHNNYTYDKNQLGKLHQKFAKIMNVDREVKSHEILTLLLRLRQICCHPGLVKDAIEASELDSVELGQENLNESKDDSEIDILRKLQNLKIDENEDIGGTTISVNSNNDVFCMDIPSSKIEILMDVLREKISNSNDKAIIVSQWVSYLNIVKGMLAIENIGFCELNGSIPVKFRNDIVNDFNNPNSDKRIMLLSITAGGVGLNLVGANLLFVMDPHWNPQIEQQAQDRIYRFGQKKDVTIFKFISEDTIEENIVKIQQKKMEIATSTLTGAKRNASKLTLDDLKDLFGMK